MGVGEAAFGVEVPLVAAVDDGVAGVHEGGERGDGLVNGGAGFDQDDDGAGFLEREDEVARGVVAGEGKVAFGVGPVQGVVDFGGGAVEDGDWEPLFGDV